MYVIKQKGVSQWDLQHLNGGVMLGIVGANMNINNALPIISQIPVSPMQYGALIAGCAVGSIVLDIDTPTVL